MVDRVPYDPPVLRNREADWFQNRYHIKLRKEDVSRRYLYAGPDTNGGSIPADETRLLWDGSLNGGLVGITYRNGQFPAPDQDTNAFTIDWGDGSPVENHQWQDATNHSIDGASGGQAGFRHTYATPGPHEMILKAADPFTCQVTGTGNNAADWDLNLVGIRSFGNMSLGQTRTFLGAENMVVSPSDPAFDLSSLLPKTWAPTSQEFNRAFSNCDVVDFNLSGMRVTGPNLFSAFQNCALLGTSGAQTADFVFGQPIESAASVFNGCNALDVDASSWDISLCTSLSSAFNNTAMSPANYDKLLIAFAAQAPGIQSNVSLGAANVQYTSAAQAAHDLLTGTYGWNIVDGGPVA